MPRWPGATVRPVTSTGTSRFRQNPGQGSYQSALTRAVKKTGETETLLSQGFELLKKRQWGLAVNVFQAINPESQKQNERKVAGLARALYPQPGKAEELLKQTVDPSRWRGKKYRSSQQLCHCQYFLISAPLRFGILQEASNMERSEQKRFEKLYQKHLTTLKLQGKSKSTIDLYSRPLSRWKIENEYFLFRSPVPAAKQPQKQTSDYLRRLAVFFNRCPDQLKPDDLKTCFSALVESHSWSTAKTDRNGLRFFWKHVLGKPWKFIEIIKPPTVKRLPVIQTTTEIELLLNQARKLRYFTLLLTLYRMGLRLAEGLNLTISVIDAQRMRVHLCNCKGDKDRYVDLPLHTPKALRQATHRNPKFLFPEGQTAMQRHQATQPMSRSFTQKTMMHLVEESRIHKKVRPHSLQHSFTT